MRAGLILVCLLPAGIGAANAPYRPSSAPTVDSQLNEKRKAIHNDALQGKDSQIPVPPLAQDEANKTVALTQNAPTDANAKRVEAAPKIRGGWLWGDNDDDDKDDNDDSADQESDKKAVRQRADRGEDAAENDNNDQENLPGNANKAALAADDPKAIPKENVAVQKLDKEVKLEGVNPNSAQNKTEHDNDPKHAEDGAKGAAGLFDGKRKDKDLVGEGQQPQFDDKAHASDTLSNSRDDHRQAHITHDIKSSNVTNDPVNKGAQHQWNSIFKKDPENDVNKGVKDEIIANAVKNITKGDLVGDDSDDKNDLQEVDSASNVQNVSDGLEISLGDSGNPERWAVMQRGGHPSAQFKCGLTDSSRLFQVSSLQAVSLLLLSDDSVSSRVDLDDSEDDIWNLHRPFQLLGGGSKDDDDGDTLIQLKNFTLTTELLPTETSLPGNATELLQVYTSPMVEDGGLVVSRNDNVEIIYVCKAAGTARIKLQALGSAGSTYCFEWLKHCKPSWDGFQVLETGTGKTVAEDGRLTAGWQPATSGTTVSFMLTHPGSEGSIRLKGVSVTSSNPKVNVTLRGALDTIINETAPVANIITVTSDIAEQVDVIYTCSDSEDEQTDVMLKLYNEASAVPPLEISWTAHCSKQALNDISATISSCRAKKNSSSLQQSQAMFKGDVSDMFKNGILTVAADDDCTALLFTAESPDTIIELSPSHQLIYDRKILMIANKVGTVETTITGDTLLRIPYICLDEGTTDVALTVYFKNKSSADFHWKKACEKPGVHTSAMLTGHHIFAILMALFLSSFLLCFISRSRTLTQFILRKLGDCCPWCCRRRQSASSDERTQFTAFGVAV